MKPKDTGLKPYIAAKHLYSDLQGKVAEVEMMRGFLARLQLRSAVVEPRELPDFLVSFSDVRVSIEVTTLASDSNPQFGSPERRLHSQWKRIAERLRNLLSVEMGPLPHVYGAVFLNAPSCTVLDAIDHEQFCKEIILALKAMPSLSERSVINEFDSSLTPLLASHVEHLFIRVLPKEMGFLWWCSDLQSGRVLSPYDAIRAMVQEKQRKAANCRWPENSEKWLLIYAAGNGLADIAVNIEDPSIGSIRPFDYVFLWDKFSETITVLAPTFDVVLENAKTLYLKRIPDSVRPFIASSFK